MTPAPSTRHQPDNPPPARAPTQTGPGPENHVGETPREVSIMPQADAYLEARLHRHRTVEDVMTSAVVTVDRLTPFKEIARLLAEHRISSVPVLADGWQVIGLVSETDLLTAQDGRVHRSGTATLTAGELMTAPPVTIGVAATISAATRVMTVHHATSLPVTGADQQLIGIVSRRDLLSVFLRPDADILRVVRQLFDEMPFRNPADISVSVRHGVVTLSGLVRCRPGRQQDLMPAAIRLIWAVDGVVDVANRITEGEGPYQAGKSALG
jgi:CBS domain-containing protein